MGPSQAASTSGGEHFSNFGPSDKRGFIDMEIAEFVPLSEKTKKSMNAKKKSLASMEETKRKAKDRRAFKEREKLFEQISLRTGHPKEKVDRNTCLSLGTVSECKYSLQHPNYKRQKYSDKNAALFEAWKWCQILPTKNSMIQPFFSIAMHI